MPERRGLGPPVWGTAYFGGLQFWSSVSGGIEASLSSTFAKDRPSRARW